MLQSINIVDAQRPSFFEMVYQEEIATSFKPALSWIIDVLALRHQSFRHLQKHIDEVYLLLCLFMEKRSLTTVDASFAEYIYVLKRHSTSRKEGGLNNMERAMSLFFLALFPYLKNKLDAWYIANNPQINRRIVQSSSSNQGSRDSTSHLSPAERALIKVYPYLNMAYQMVVVGYQIAYLFERTRYYSPFFHLMKIDVRRASMEDMVSDQKKIQQQRLDAVNSITGDGFFSTVLRNLTNVWYVISNQTTNIITAVFIFFRFLAWWYTIENQIPTKTLPVPPPPKKIMPAPGGVNPKLPGNTCPLCRSHRTNPTMCPSGYAFCYPCIHDYVSQYNRCPVTHIPTTVDVLRKLYEAS